MKSQVKQGAEERTESTRRPLSEERNHVEKEVVVPSSREGSIGGVDDLLGTLTSDMCSELSIFCPGFIKLEDESGDNNPIVIKATLGQDRVVNTRAEAGCGSLSRSSDIVPTVASSVNNLPGGVTQEEEARKERQQRTVFVSYRDFKLTKRDFQSHFEKFGRVEYFAIPTPWQCHAYVTFDDAQVARQLYGKRHYVRGAKVLTKSGKTREEHRYFYVVGKEMNKSRDNIFLGFRFYLDV